VRDVISMRTTRALAGEERQTTQASAVAASRTILMAAPSVRDWHLAEVTPRRRLPVTAPGYAACIGPGP